MSIRSIFLHSENFAHFKAYDGYPWLFERSQATADLCRRNGLLEREGIEVREPTPADKDALLVYHTKAYVEVLEKANEGKFEESMLALGVGTMECPVYQGCLDYPRLIVGSSLMAVDALLKEDVRLIFAPTGGMHHAGPDFASGFCYLNDPVLAILRLLEEGLRVLYVDIDVHHGDMVQEAFYEDNRVLNISFHESGETLFPHKSGFVEEIGKGRGEGYNVNVPVPAGTGDEVYIWTFERLFPPIVEAFRPDIVVAVLGADTLASDPMSNLRLTTEGYCETVRWIQRLSPRILGFGCGGYVLDTLSRAWTLAWAILNEIPLSDDAELLYGGVFRGDGLPSLQDRPVFIQEETRRRTLEKCRRTVQYIEKHHFPKLGITR
jgi:acetoin utilization protein AcuC